jgi:clan AA aspartic protease (TIGR02281 family)
MGRAAIEKIKMANKVFQSMLMLVLIPMTVSNPAHAGDDLFAQIQALQDRNRIQVIGSERIENAEKVMISGSLDQQIKQLFGGYNHIVSRNAKGRIERIIIVNKKQEHQDNRIVLPTHLRGNHVTVSVSLSGDGSNWQTVDMVVDTGADLVVLPDSMIAQLGLAEYQFKQARMQTANGMTDARIGTLQEVNIAGETLENVEVAFITDRLLAGNKLLGMSVLGRFQVTLDDQSHVMTLIEK